MIIDNVRRLAKKNSREEGFSLLELTISVLIIGILAAIAVPIFMNQQKEALKQEVRQDVLNTAANVSQWQAAQDGLVNPVPTDTATKTKLTVKTNSATTITIRGNTADNPSTRIVCVEGSRNISGTFIVSYELNTKTLAERACDLTPDDMFEGETYN